MKPFVLLRASTRPIETLAPLRGEACARAASALLDLEDARSRRAEALGGDLYEAAGEASASDAERARGRLALVALRRSVHNDRPPRPSDLEAARPWIPPDLHRRLLAHEEERRGLDGARAAFRGAHEADLLQGRRAIAALGGDPLFAGAVWLSSRSLLPAVRALADRDPAEWGHGERHAAAKAAAYLARFCTKTSPNGLFCATAPAAAVDGPAAAEGSARVERVEILLNVYEARKVAACLAVDEALRGAIVPRPNPTLRLRDRAWTFWRPASLRNPDEEEVLSRVRHHPVVERFLEEAGRGDRNVPDLIGAVARDVEAPAAEVEAFFGTLVERGILIAEVEIPYNDRRPLRTLAAAARGAGCGAAWVGALEEIEDGVDRLHDLDGAARVKAMERISGALEALPHRRPIRRDELFRLDAASGLRVRLPARLLREARAGLGLYARLFAAMYPESIHRSALAARFLKLHPADTDVNLVDVYHGAFEPAEKVRPTAFPDPVRLAPSAPGARAASEAMARARDLFASRARRAAPGEEVAIGEEDLLDVIGDVPEPRWTCGALLQAAARGPRDLDEGRCRLVLSGLFQGTGLALARFASLHGGGAPPGRNPVVADLRRGWSCLRREGAILAEITYNHNARTANAGLRPSIFAHEIELPGEKAAPGADVILLRDLTVRWDRASERFVLRSVSRGVEVVPVINSGVNPVGFISFLIDVGQQGIQPLGLFPGFEAEGVVRWPRFAFGRLVVFRERWSLPPAGQPPVSRGGAALSDAEFFLEVARLRRRHGLPRHVFLHTPADPKPRYVDLESPVFVDLLRRSLPDPRAGGASSLEITEMLPGPDDLWIAGPEGRYASEFLVHLQNPEPGAPSGAAEAAR